MAVQPDRIERVVAASAGWYLWPDATFPYPVGTDTRATPTPLTPSFQALCTLPFLALVGENDDATVEDPRNTQASGVDLVALEGSGRRAKAENWVAAVHELAMQQGWPCRLALEIAPRTGHQITDALFTTAASFLRGAR